MSWQTPKTNWDTHPKAIEPADMNRIEGNILAVREQNNMALRLEVVDSFPSHAPGRAIYHTGNKLAYVSDGSQWIAVGGDGDAGTEHVLEGKKFSSRVAGVGAVGSMPNHGAITISPGKYSKTIPAGYHNGQGYVAGDANLVAGNIRGGVSIFGIEGDLTNEIRVASENVKYSSPDVVTVSSIYNTCVKRFRNKYRGTYRLRAQVRCVNGTGCKYNIGGETGEMDMDWKDISATVDKVGNSSSYVYIARRVGSFGSKAEVRNFTVGFDILPSTIGVEEGIESGVGV